MDELEKAVDFADEGVDKTVFNTKVKIRKVIDSAKEQAGKSAFIAFLGAFYLLSTTGTVNEKDILTIAISIIVFIAGTIIILIIWLDRRKNEQHLDEFKEKIIILESDFFKLNKKHSEVVNSFVSENHRQLNHFYELLRTVEDTGNFGILIYSYETGKILSVNTQFRSTFNMDESYLNSRTEPENTKSNNLISMIMILIHQDSHNEILQIVDKLISGEIERYSMNVYARINLNMPLKFVPFKIILTKLKFAIEESLHFVFIDETSDRSMEELMKAHYQTILSYTKELLAGKMDENLSRLLIRGLTEYQKQNKRILISDLDEQ